MDKTKTIHGKCTCIQPAFSAYRTQLTGKTSAPFERALNSGYLLVTSGRIFVFIYDFCF